MAANHGRRSDERPVPIAVVGAGIMGTNHARVLSRLSGFNLVGIVDPDADRAQALANSVGVEALSIESLKDRVRAAVIATPSETHAEIACDLLEAGLDVLIEKPIATSVDDARQIIDVAKQNECVAMVGHIERFNAAVIGLKDIIDEPVHFEFTRTGPFSSRVTSDVILDLMIHDIDLFRMLSGASEFTSAFAVGGPVKSSLADFASCLVRGDNGVTATFTASRAGQNKIRTIEVTQRSNFVVADLLRQDVNIHRVAHSEFISEGGTRYSQTGVMEIPFLDRTGEPLRLELESFLCAIVERSVPVVDGSDGLAALREALNLAASVQEGRRV